MGACFSCLVDDLQNNGGSNIIQTQILVTTVATHVQLEDNTYKKEVTQDD